MTFDEYWTRFRLLQFSADREEKLAKLLAGEAYANFVRRFGNTDSPVLQRFSREKEKINASCQKKDRLCKRYAARLAEGICAIPQPELREYARYYYLYGLTREQVAEVSGISVRTAYRHARLAKEALEKAMLSVSPSVRRIPSAKFRLKQGVLRRKDYGVGKMSRSIAAMTSRRKSEPFFPLVFQFEKREALHSS